MENRSASIEKLQTALSMELTAVQQYLLHVHTLEDWGLDKLSARMRDEMQEELGHAGRFIDRILFLGGTPELTATKTPKKSETMKELLESDKREEGGAIAFYSEAAKTADGINDIGTRRLFEEIVEDEEGHWDWLDRQLHLLERMGEPAYISIYMSGDSGQAQEG